MREHPKESTRRKYIEILIQGQDDYNTGASPMQVQPLSLRISLPLCHLVMNAEFTKLTSEMME